MQTAETIEYTYKEDVQFVLSWIFILKYNTRTLSMIYHKFVLMFMC